MSTMNKFYIIILDFIISVLSVIIEKYNGQKYVNDDKKISNEENEEDNIYSRSSRNTFYKLLLIKKNLENNKNK